MSSSRSEISVAGWSFGSTDAVGSNRPLKEVLINFIGHLLASDFVKTIAVSLSVHNDDASKTNQNV